MADNNDKKPGLGNGKDGSGGYEMKLGFGTIAMLISATGMGLVPLFSRWATRTDMFNGAAGFNAGDSIGALMAVGRMGMGVLFFLILLVATHKVHVFKKLKLTPAIALGGLMIGMSLACYVTSTLLTTVSNAVLFIYIGPVICVLLARIFRKEPMSILQWVCLGAVFVGMLFGEGLLGFGVGGQAFGFDFNLVPSTPEFPMKGIGDAFGIASGFFYGASMFFNGYRKDADTTARGVWNFIFAVIGAGAITIVLNSLGANPGMENWALNVHFTTFNWIGAVLLWIICGPIALGFLLVAGRNLPAADYGTIAYWEVPVALFCGLVVFGEPFTINTALGAILIIGGGAIPSIKGMVAGRKQKQRDEISENLTARLDQEPQQTGVSAELAAAPAPSVALADAEPLKITESLTHIATKMEFEPAKSEDELQAVFVEQGLQGFPAKLDIVERTEDHVQMMSLQELLRFAKASNVGAVTYDVTYFPHADNAEVEYQLHQLARDLGISAEVIRDLCANEIREYLELDAKRDASAPVHSIVEAYIGGTAFAWYGMNDYPRLKRVILRKLAEGGQQAKSNFIMRASKAQVDLLEDY
ncbi:MULTISPECIES: DMT family transporter [Gordonibacter]|uniref:DMT family transporter n=1 Tax=Gordonibacter TaxID=644652 RepID=UPI001D9D3551|nr:MULTISPECIES: DMT family transporter [Gordonibacter]MDN4508402.1 DMT family transporter [Gordonibacter sp. RACS_AR49]HJF61935.1 DMT family transporter [Gordonibacter urolithinfaciens]